MVDFTPVSRIKESTVPLISTSTIGKLLTNRNGIRSFFLLFCSKKPGCAISETEKQKTKQKSNRFRKAFEIDLNGIEGIKKR